jgi:Gas vesicle synthesis protein GvpO
MANSVAHAEGQAAPAAGATSTADRLSVAELAERVRAELLEGPGPGAKLASAAAQPVSAAQIAERAKAELSRITGLDADHVSGVLAGSDGWHVTVDLIELRRIPASTDVLGAYEAVFAPTGILMSYRRTRRYFRDQMMEQS